MTIKQILDFARHRPIYTDLLTKSENSGYNCIADDCDNGTGDDATGATVVNDAGLKCHKCGGWFTNVDVVAHRLGISVTGAAITGKNAYEVAQFIAKRENLFLTSDDDSNEHSYSTAETNSKNLGTVEPKNSYVYKNQNTGLAENPQVNEPQPNSATEENEKLAAKYAEFVAADLVAADNLDSMSEKDLRGLPVEFLRQHGCIHAENWIHPKTRAKASVKGWNQINIPPTRRLLIPTSDRHYAAVALDRDKVSKGDWKKHAGKIEPFVAGVIASADLIIIVEGEIDAMSIEYATGGAVPAIATGGANNDKQAVKYLKVNNLQERRFVILFDDDDGGHNGAEKLKSLLASEGIVAVAAYFEGKTVDGKKIDANQILQDNGAEALATKLSEKISVAQIEFEAAKKIAAPQDTSKVEDSRQTRREKNDLEMTVAIGEIHSDPLAEALAENEALAEGAVEEKKSATLSRETLADCPLDVNIPSSFILDWRGLIFKKKRIRGDYYRLEEVPVCSTPIIVTKNLASNDGNEFVEVAFKVKGAKKWRREIISKLTVADGRKLIELSSRGVTITAKTVQWLSTYLTEQIDWGDNHKRIPRQMIYHRTGWLDDNFKTFIYPNTDNVIVTADDGKHDANFYNEAFAVKGNLATWKDMCRHVLNTSTAARFAFGAALAAPLLKVLGISNQWAHLASESGKGKTAANYFAASIYGNPDKFIQSMDGTTLALEQTASLFNDLPSILREFQTVGKTVRENFDRDIYKFGEGTGRLRCKKDGTLQPIKKFRGVRMTDGEQTLTTEHSGAGALKRATEFFCNEVFDNDFAVEIYRFVKEHYGLVGRIWIETIRKHKAQIQIIFEEYENFYRDKFPNAYPNHISFVAAIMVAGFFFEGKVLAFENENLVYRANYIADAEKIFASLQPKDTSTNAARAISDVAEFFTRYELNFLNYDEDSNEATANDDKLKPREIFGYIMRYGGVAFLPNVFRNMVLKDYPSASAIIRGFSDAGYLDEGSSPKHAHQKLISVGHGVGRKKIWVYIVKEAGIFSDADKKVIEKNEIVNPEKE